MAWARRDAPAHLALGIVLALSAVLELHRLSQNGFANVFYSAAVKSQLASFHNFLYVAFDRSGLASVDKPPLGVWLQVASAKLFGLHPLSLLVPEAIVTVLAVGALYWILARRYGAWAGVGGALALALFPSFAAVGRDNNPDALLILLMVLACGSALTAAETGRWRSLLTAALLVGLAFNTKTLAAYLVVPGIAVAFVVCAPGGLLRRATQLAAAGALLAVVSFAWIAYVDLTPAHTRPFVGSSTDNTELGLTFSYNGVGRVGGQYGGPTDLPGFTGPRLHPRPIDPAKAGVPPVPRHGRARRPFAFGGPTGPLRLLGVGLGDQGGWMLPFAVAGSVAMALAWWLAVLASGASAPAEVSRRRDPRLAGLIVLGGWFAVEATVLSFSQGIVHPYYVSALGPGAGALVGAGAVEMVRLRRHSPWWGALAALAGAGTLVAQSVLMRREYFHTGARPALAIAVMLAVGALWLLRDAAAPAMAVLLIVLLLVPGAYTLTLWDAPVQSTFPAAGPHQTAGHGGVGLTAVGLRANLALIAYLRTQRTGTRWSVLTVSSTTAGPLMLLGSNAGALGGYGGADPALDGPGLARLVASGQARHVLLGGNYSGRGGNGALRAVQAVCTLIPASVWHASPAARPVTRARRGGARTALGRGPGPTVSKIGRAPTLLTLYDCAAAAPALAAQRGPA